MKLFSFIICFLIFMSDVYGENNLNASSLGGESYGVSGTLPILNINVKDEEGNFIDEIIDYNLAHKNYFSGEYWLDLNGCNWMDGAQSIGSEVEPLPLEIKARGNWTRTAFSKKPFKLKLGKKQSLLGLSKSKHFALLAHADDHMGYLRNFVGFNLGRRIGLPWTPSQQPVEVIINGDYRGLYFLTESIRVEEERVNIQELGNVESDPMLVSGGYIIELDNYDESEQNQIQIPEKGQHHSKKDFLKITFDTPEKYSDIQYNFIYDQFVKMNDFVGEVSDELWSYIDLDDAVRYYLVCEIISHIEAYSGSTYLYRDRGNNQKWHFSPLWDLGQAFNGPTENFIYECSFGGMNWIGSIAGNLKFDDKVKETWKWFMSNNFEGIYSDMEFMITHIEAAAKADSNRWTGVPVPTNPSTTGCPVYDNSEIFSKFNFVKERLESKVKWLTAQFGDYHNQIYSEPAKDLTPAAPLPDFLTSSIQVSPIINDMKITYYNLNGQKVNSPQKGQIYIMVSDMLRTKTLDYR